jgi:hypothetical protein
MAKVANSAQLADSLVGIAMPSPKYVRVDLAQGLRREKIG